jgi:hypothetical protein
MILVLYTECLHGTEVWPTHPSRKLYFDSIAATHFHLKNGDSTVANG